MYIHIFWIKWKSRIFLRSRSLSILLCCAKTDLLASYDDKLLCLNWSWTRISLKTSKMCIVVTFAKLMLLCFQEHDLPQRGKKNAGSTVFSLSQNILFLSNVLKNAYVLCGKYFGIQHCSLYSVIEKSNSKGKADLQSDWGTTALFFNLFIASFCKNYFIFAVVS